MEDNSEQQILQTAQQAKVHKEMCRRMGIVVNAMVRIFPDLEAVRPGCRAGMQALSVLHLSLEKGKSLLQYCSKSSKLYLAMTGESLMHKFERIRLNLDENLRQLAAILSQNLVERITSVLDELNQASFFLDPADKELGGEIVSLLLSKRPDEKEIFNTVATKLGLISPKALLEEWKSLTSLLEKAQSEGDSRKKSIFSYLLHLLKHYGKSIKSSSSNSLLSKKNLLSTNSLDWKTLKTTISAKEAPCSLGMERSIDKIHTNRNVATVPNVPEQFVCPICHRIMSDPVIISSGHTFERACIEEWFQKGHDTCPKTHEKLKNLSLTPNTCVKNLITVWCKKNDVPSSPSSPFCSAVSLNSDSDSFSSLVDWKKSDEVLQDGIVLLTVKGDTCSSDLEEKHTTPSRNPGMQIKMSQFCDGYEVRERLEKTSGGHCNLYRSSEDVESMIADVKSLDWEVQLKAAEVIWFSMREKPLAFSHHADDLIPLLVDFLLTAFKLRCSEAQEIGILILLNLCVYNRSDKATNMAVRVVPYILELLKVTCNLNMIRAAVSIVMLLSYVDSNKEVVGSSGVIPFLVELLDTEQSSYISDALITLCNLSTVASNQLCIIHANAIPKLVRLLRERLDHIPVKCLTLLCNVSSVEEGRYAILAADGCIPSIVELLEMGTIEEQEQAVSALLCLCVHSFTISQSILNEGVIPSLVSLSVGGSPRGKDQATRLLQFYRDQRREQFTAFAVH